MSMIKVTGMVGAFRNLSVVSVFLLVLERLTSGQLALTRPIKASCFLKGKKSPRYSSSR